DVDIRRRDRVEPRQNAAAHKGQGEALVAVAEVVAAGEDIVLGEAVIDLGDHTVYAVRGPDGGQQVVAVDVKGLVRRRPGIAGQQLGNDRINHPAVVGDGSVELCLCRHASQGGNAHVFTLAFIRYKPEGPVSLEGTAE